MASSRVAAMRRRGGFGLVDIVVLIFVVSLVIIPLVGIFPVSRLAVKKAEDLQTAVFLAQRTLNQFRAVIPSTVDTSYDDDPATTDVHDVFSETLNERTFSITRDVYGLQSAPDPADSTKQRVLLMDVVVKVEWPGMQAPFLLTTRVSRMYLDLQKNLIVKPDPTAVPTTPPGSKS